MSELSRILDLHRLIFAREPNRLSLLRYTSTARTIKRIQVFRNHSFEIVERTLPAYFDCLDFAVEFIHSDYDDSFTFSALDASVDAIILWVDAARYKTNPSEFIVNRLSALRQKYTGFLLLVAFDMPSISISMDGVIVVDTASELAPLGSDAWDVASEAFTGTRLSRKACMLMSRMLGLRYIPAMLMPPMKAVVVDFDNTLYSGVLGEDGADALILSSEHIRIQNRLVQLAESGIFVCGVTKNNPYDVETLLERRQDFPLKRNHFSCLIASWDAKSKGVREICSRLNIGADSILFVDDNIGELSEVAINVPGIKIALADANGEQTSLILNEYPGFFRLSRSREDAVRSIDVVANEERSTLRSTMTAEEYLKNLQMEITVRIDDAQTIDRVAELSRKTNQFIFSYRRYTPSEVSSLMDGNDTLVMALSLKDRLSDSGIICGIVLRAIDDYAILDECFVSCRALGRGIEHDFIFSAVESGLKRLAKSKLLVKFTAGERNEPAQRFVNQWLLRYLSKPTLFIPAVCQPCLKFNYGGQ